MVGHIEVMQPGLQTTVQDLGRLGFQALGIPPSGALDAPSLRLANHLVGNAVGAAALEIRLAGPVLAVAAPTIRLALTGTAAPFVVERGDARREVPANRAVMCRAGDVVRVGALRDTATAYLAISGGIDVAPVFGSRSTYLRGGLGGLDGRPLMNGDMLPLGPSDEGAALLALPRAPASDAPDVLRVVLGPQADWFTEDDIAAFLAGPYRVTPEADRMGMRLDGPKLGHPRGYNLVSDANVSGSIQVPGSRLPILLLAEHGTTGGYPKIATVISADLAKAGRLAPGREVRFAAVTVEAAEAAARAGAADVSRLLASAVPVADAAEIDMDALHSANLISGVVGATHE